MPQSIVISHLFCKAVGEFVPNEVLLVMVALMHKYSRSHMAKRTWGSATLSQMTKGERKQCKPAERKAFDKSIAGIATFRTSAEDCHDKKNRGRTPDSRWFDRANANFPLDG